MLGVYTVLKLIQTDTSDEKPKVSH